MPKEDPKIIVRHPPPPAPFAQDSMSTVARRILGRLGRYFSSSRGQHTVERSGVRRIVLKDLPPGTAGKIERQPGPGQMPFTVVAALDPAAITTEEYIRGNPDIMRRVTEHELGHLYGLQREYAPTEPVNPRLMAPTLEEFNKWKKNVDTSQPISDALFPSPRYATDNPDEFYAEAWRTANRLAESPNITRASRIAHQASKGDLWGQTVGAIYKALVRGE